MAKSSSKPSSKAAKKAQVPVRAPSPVLSTSSRSDEDQQASSSSSSSSSSSDSDSTKSDRSSVSPEPENVVPKPRRVDPLTQKYTPPAGFKLAKNEGNQSSLDWDEFNRDQDLQLWAVRVPAGLKAKHLDKMVIQLPTDSTITTPLQPVSTFTASKVDYEAYLSTPHASTSSSKRKRTGAEEEGDEEVQQSTELDSMVPLLPKKSAGNKLYKAPRSVARTLTIRRSLPAALASLPSAASFSHSTLIASQPSPVPGALLSASDLLLDPQTLASKKKPHRPQPSGLKFRLALGGGEGVKGGMGQFENSVELRDRDAIIREGIMSAQATAEAALAAEEEAMAAQQQQLEAVGEEREPVGMEDVEMEKQEEEEVIKAEPTVSVDDEKAKKKAEKKAKKEKKRKEEGGAAVEGVKSPKKKKVKTEQ